MTGLVVLILAAQATVIPKVIVTVAEPEAVVVEAGGRTETQLPITVAEGFRIQASPAAEPFLVAASLEIEDSEPVRVGPPEYPAGKPYRLQGADSDLSIYEGTFVITLPVEAGDPGKGVEVTLEGQLRYQACNDVVCLKPSSVPVMLPVQLLGVGEAPAH